MAKQPFVATPTDTKRPTAAHDYGDKKGKGAYPLCACGCGIQTNPGSFVVGYPHTRHETLWCATDKCASGVKARLMSAEARQRIYAPWS